MFLKTRIGLAKVGTALRAFSKVIIDAVGAAKEFNNQLEKISHLIKEEENNEQEKC